MESKHYAPPARDEMTSAQFNARMAEGYAQAQKNQSSLADEVFSRLFEEIKRGKAV